MTKSKIDIQEVNRSWIENVPGIDFVGEDLVISDNIDDILLLSVRPVRLRSVVFAFCTQGNLRMRINMEEYRISANHLFLTLPDQIIQQLERSDDVVGHIIVVSKIFLEEIIPQLQNTLSAFLYIKDHPVTELNEKEVKCLEEYYNFLWKKVKHKENLFRKEIVSALLLALFYEVSGIFKNHVPIETKKTRQEELFSSFIKALRLHYQKERSVRFYADLLCVTPKYLSLLVKNVSNRTTGEWIDDYVVMEAKALLSSSTLSVQEIADRLNFANQSFFGKYFKKHVGISPLAYRKKR